MRSEDSKYERALKRVKEIKGFYNHLVVYILVNIVLQLFYAGVFDNGRIAGNFPYWVRFTTPFFWGLSLIGHGIYAFKGNIFKNVFKNWEKRKIKEIMEQQEAESKHWS